MTQWAAVRMYEGSMIAEKGNFSEDKTSVGFSSLGKGVLF